MAFRSICAGLNALRRSQPIGGSHPYLSCRGKFLTRNFSNEVIVSARNLSFEYVDQKPILNEVNFSIREGNKVTIMGQNGSGICIVLSS